MSASKTIEADIEERVTMRLELNQLRDAVTNLAKEMSNHISQEEEERRKLEGKLTILIGLMILILSGVDLVTMLQLMKGF